MAEPILHLDLSSPYAWLAAERAESVLGVAPRLEPIVLGAIFRVRGWGSWAHTGRRAAGMAEVERRAAAYGLPPVVWPEVWPADSLHGARAAVWAERHGRGDAFIRAAFRAIFGAGRDVADHDVLRDVSAEVGLPAAELEDAIAEPALKEELKRRTTAAIDRGVRGVPTLQIGDELIFGDDRLETATLLLRGV
jgi:2-hydroxychromene-2-carboxylate isomerase